MPVLSSDLFSFHADDWIFTSEESTLRGNVGRWYGQAFNDALDEGFGIISPKTGKVVYFCKVSTDVVDGEEKGWYYRPFKGQYVVDEESLRVLVIND
jgi:hypothetical protein